MSFLTTLLLEAAALLLPLAFFAFLLFLAFGA